MRRVLVVAIVVIVLAELVVRLMDDRLPEPLTWYHPMAQVKIEQMDALRASGVDVQLVLAGTSQTAEGVLPLRLQDELAGHPSTYNAALLAGYPTAMRRFIPEEVLPRLHPKTVVYGMSSEDMEPGPEAPYDSALATEPGVLGSLDRWASAHSALFRHRQDLRDPTVVSAAITEGAGGGQLAYYRDAVVGPAGGWTAPTHAHCEAGDDGAVRPEVPGTFVVDPQRMGAVWSTVDAIRGQGIEVIVLVVPFADCYFERTNRLQADADGRALIAAEARRRGLQVIDVSAEVHTDDLFNDPGHLNEAGARRFTDLVAAAIDRR